MLRKEDLQIVTVSENTSTGRGLLGEWGLSVFIKTPDLHILLDAGASGAISQNLDSLGIDPVRIGTLVLSHGHSDHTGGLHTLLLKRQKRELNIVAHPAVWAPKYSKDRSTGNLRYAGLPFNREELESLGARFSLTAEPTWITADIVTSGLEPMETEFEAVAESLYVREGGEFVQDPMEDDQSLFLKTELGLVIILGCAHRGVVNVIRHARKLTGVERVYMVLGGTHLGPASEQQVLSTISALREIGIRRLGVSHCTGLKVASRLAREFGEKFFFNNVGTTIELPFNP